MLLRHSADPDQREITGVGPLHVACDRGRADIASELLTAGASVNLDTHDQISPLYFAAKSGSAATVELLLSSGADVNQVRVCCRLSRIASDDAVVVSYKNTRLYRTGEAPLIVVVNLPTS